MKRKKGSLPEPFVGFVDPEKAARIEAYTEAKIIPDLFSDIAGKAFMAALLFCNGLAWLSNSVENQGWSSLAKGLVFFGLIALAVRMLSLPFEWYGTFRVEEKFGFNRTGYKLWIIDILKDLILGTIIGGLLLAAVLWILYNTGELWWLICWAVVFLFSLIISVLFPLVIAPIFNKFKPLEEGEFKEKVLSLMKAAGVNSSGVYVMDAGKRSSHTNAYFTGIGKVKRIVFYDTLLEKHSHDEALAVLAHEAGHWKKKHVIKHLALSQAISLGIFALSGWLVNWNELYTAFGFKAVTPYAGLFLLFIAYSPLLFFIQPVTSSLSRRHEYEADDYAGREMGFKEALSTMLIKSTVDNLSNLNPHPSYVFFNYSHPTITQRVIRLKALTPPPIQPPPQQQAAP